MQEGKEQAGFVRETVDECAHSQDVANLTAEQAKEFAELGLPEMRKMIGYPVGVTPKEYLRFLEGGKNYRGQDLKRQLARILEEHSKKASLVNAE